MSEEDYLLTLPIGNFRLVHTIFVIMLKVTLGDNEPFLCHLTQNSFSYQINGKRMLVPMYMLLGFR